MKNLRGTFRDMTPDEMRVASREAEISEWCASNVPADAAARR